MDTKRCRALEAAIFAVVLLVSTAAHARVECIASSSYRALSAITAGNTAALARGLGEPRRLPPADGCRAALLTGPVDARMVTDLLQAIRAGGGWLAVLYVAFSDGDPAAEVRLAEATRMFGLDVIVMRTDIVYTPDFLANIEPLPASVSYAWTEAERQSSRPLAEHLAHYLEANDRRITRGGSACGPGCFTVLAAGATRTIFHNNRAIKDEHIAPPGNIGPAEDGMRRAVREQFGMANAPTWHADGWSVSHLERFAPFVRLAVDKQCRGRLDYLASRRDEISRTIEGYSARDFPNMALGKIVPQVRAVREAEESAQTCVAETLDRIRARVFGELFRPGRSDAQVLALIDSRLAALRSGRSQIPRAN